MSKKSCALLLCNTQYMSVEILLRKKQGSGYAQPLLNPGDELTQCPLNGAIIKDQIHFIMLVHNVIVLYFSPPKRSALNRAAQKYQHAVACKLL